MQVNKNEGKKIDDEVMTYYQNKSLSSTYSQNKSLSLLFFDNKYKLFTSIELKGSYSLQPTGNLLLPSYRTGLLVYYAL